MSPTRARAARPLQDMVPVQMAEIEHTYVPEDDTSVCTQVSFHNPTTRAAFEQMFGIKPNERLVAVTVTERGVSARIGRK